MPNNQTFFEVNNSLGLSTLSDAINLFKKKLDGAPGTFIQVGAHEGGGDAVGRNIDFSLWSGVLVEPHPLYFDRLAKKYEKFSKNIGFLNAAISSTEGQLDLHYVPEELAPISWARCINTIDPSKGRINEFEELVETCKVSVYTIPSIQEKYQLTEVDILFVDTEGHDFEVIKGIRMDRSKPKIIHFEDRHLSCEELDQCVGFLARHGYSLFIEPHPNDATAYLANELC
ncbi:MAG: FkbM family methyltransferase [Verrucomicrobiota bacterium]